MKKVLIDTDPGMDDTLAIILAAKSPEIELLGISSVAGNYPIEVTTRNALKTLELIGKTAIPVARGMGKPLARPLAKDPFSHGSDGQAENHLPEPKTQPSGQHGVDQIIDMVKAHPGEVTVVTLGPFTNLAMAVMKEPAIVGMIAEVVSIAGSFGLNKYAFANATGDTPQSEWNVFVDPEAARVVFESGVKLRAVGLDVATHFDINFTEEQLGQLKASGRPEAKVAEKMVRFVQGRGFESYCVLIDFMAVAAVIDPTLIGTLKARVGVETRGELTLGQTVADFRHHHGWAHLPEIDVAATADYGRFLDLVMTTLLGKPMDRATQERIYAGVLGKIIGVYHGRPVEGWSYERIMETFGEVNYFVNGKMNLPIMLPDDDISGTFGFFCALEDHGYPKVLDPQQVGKTWLNYIIEEKTILWWGGLGRSTEHTAYLRLKDGIAAPRSGSHELNGPWIPAQIGAQIFMDAFAMANPNDPDRAAQMVRAAASVSHDGIALDAAVLLGTMEAMAFSEKNVDKLLDGGLKYVSDNHLKSVIDGIRNETAKTNDWHRVRAWIAANHGYAQYDGPCHMVPNHSIVLMSLLMAGDDFARSLMIATSAGWDTDCNAGNIGCLNGIRLGLDALNKGPDLRGPVSDFLYVVTSDGAAGISDAVQQTRKIVAAANVLNDEPAAPPQPKYGFDYPGSTQGFALCPRHVGRQGAVLLSNDGGGLKVQLSGLSLDVTGGVSTPVFVEPFAAQSSFAMVASPTLYPGQTVTARLEPVSGLKFRLYALIYDRDDAVQRIEGPWSTSSELKWTVPDTNGLPLYRLGLEFGCDTRFDGTITVKSLDWSGAPVAYETRGMLVKSIWNLTPFWTRAWVSSAKHFAPDFKYTLCFSHPAENGVATTGSRDWDDYSVASSLDYSINDGAGLVARARGHRRYYAGMLKGAEALIVKRHDEVTTVLSRVPVAIGAEGKRDLKFEVSGSDLRLFVDGKPAGAVQDQTFDSGSAGFIVERGTIVADGFLVHAL